MAGTGNRPAREKFEFSLDARQVAGVILGSLGALGMAFFLGHALGQRVAELPATAARASAPAAPPADPLAALDQAPRPDGGEPQAPLSFHEALTSARPPPDRLPPAPSLPKAQVAQAPAPRAAPAVASAASPVPAATPASSGPTGPSGATGPLASPGGPPPASGTSPAPAAPTPAPPTPVAAVATGTAAAAGSAPATGAGPSAAAEPVVRKGASEKGAFVVQVGSTQERFEAERIAARFAGRGARVTVADVPGKGRWYRVRMGSFDSREAADRYLKDLQRTTGARGFVASAN